LTTDLCMGNQVDTPSPLGSTLDLPNPNKVVFHKDGDDISAFPCICQGGLYFHLMEKKEELNIANKRNVAALNSRKEQTKDSKLELDGEALQQAELLRDLTIFLHPDDKIELLKLLLPGALGGLGLGAAAPGAFIGVLGMLGFTTAGVAGGSAAAVMQSWLGSVGGGSAFALAQSAGAVGAVGAGATVGLIAGGILAGSLAIGGIAYLATTAYKKSQRDDAPCWESCQHYAKTWHHGTDCPENVKSVINAYREEQTRGFDVTTEEFQRQQQELEAVKPILDPPQRILVHEDDSSSEESHQSSSHDDDDLILLLRLQVEVESHDDENFNVQKSRLEATLVS